MENWWLRLMTTQLEWWITYFRYLQSNGFFVSGQISDTAVLLFVFMPILRREINDFVQMWNDHPIRKQRQLANHVPGVPNKLYDKRPEGERLGFQPNPNLLNDLLNSTEGFDYDAYLTDDTLAWLQQQLGQIVNQLGITTEMQTSYFSNHTSKPLAPGANIDDPFLHRVKIQKQQFNEPLEVGRRLTRVLMSYCVPLKEAMRTRGPRSLMRIIRDAMIVYYEAYKLPESGFIHGGKYFMNAMCSGY
jgi:hypothetical protein